MERRNNLWHAVVKRKEEDNENRYTLLESKEKGEGETPLPFGSSTE